MKLKLKYLSDGFTVGHDLAGVPRPKGHPDQGFQRPAFLERVMRGPRLIDHRTDVLGLRRQRSLTHRGED